MNDSGERQTLLQPGEPPPFVVERPRAACPILFVCEHASRRIPRRLGDLGLSGGDLERHIAWDIGALGLARRLAARFEATVVWQTYSRLVADCNRPPHSPTLIPEISETTPISGNRGLDPGQAQARIDEIWRPFQGAVAGELAWRLARGLPTVLVAVHSFTPVFKGVGRPWHVGFLHGADPALALALNETIGADEALVTDLNEPYAIDEEDHTIPVHGEGNGLPCVLPEVRQDLIADEKGQAEWADRFADGLGRYLASGALAGSRAGPGS